MKNIWIILGIVVLAGGLWYWSGQLWRSAPANMPVSSAASDYKNISYMIEGENIKLVNGIHKEPAAPGAAETVITEYFGNEVPGDFNNDGALDVAFLLTQSGGGTGVFYYVVAALKTAQGYQGTNAVFLGDRIAPQTTEFRNGEIIVNYADRNPGEPYSVSPSLGVSKYLKVSGGKLVEVSP